MSVSILFHYFEATTFESFENMNNLTLTEIKRRVVESFKRQLKSGHPSTNLLLFNRRKVEDYMHLQFWLTSSDASEAAVKTSKLESSLLQNDQSMRQYLIVHSTGEGTTIHCTIEVDGDKTYIATEFKEEILCAAKFCFEVYNVDETAKEGLRNTIEVDLHDKNGKKRSFPALRSDSYLEDSEHMRFVISEGSAYDDERKKMIKRLFVAVRGTVDLNNWMTNINVVSEAFHESGVGKVHKGFHDMAGKIHAAELLRRLDYTGNKNLDPTEKESLFDQIVVCGHSLGGAIASLLCSHMYLLANKSLSNKQLVCITFGAPPVGDSNFCNFITADHQYDITQSNFIHIVHEGDMVPRVMYMLEAMKRFTSECSCYSTGEMHKLSDASEKLQEALVANGSRSSMEPAFNRYFGDNPSQIRRLLKLGYRYTKSKSFIQVLYNTVLRYSIAEYESFGCVLLFPRGVESSPLVCIGDPRSELQKLEDLYNFDSCSVEWHNTAVYLTSASKFVREHCNPSVLSPAVVAAGTAAAVEEEKQDDVPVDPLSVRDNLVEILLDILSLQWIPSKQSVPAEELAIWKLRHYSVKAARDQRGDSLSSFLLHEDFQQPETAIAQGKETFSEQFKALFRPTSGSIFPKILLFCSTSSAGIFGKNFRRLWGLQLFRTLCALNTRDAFNKNATFRSFVASLFQNSKSDWEWLKADDIAAIRPFAVALEGLFDADKRKEFDSLFSFFQSTAGDIISPLAIVAAAPPPSKVLFKKGAEVEVNYKDRGEWRRGTVVNVNRGDAMNVTYDVKFEGGLLEKAVKVQLVRLASVFGYVYIEKKDFCSFWKKNVKHYIVLKEGVLSYGKSNQRLQPLYLKKAVVVEPSLENSLRNLGDKSNDDFFTLHEEGTERVLTIRAIEKDGKSLKYWKEHIDAHIRFAAGGDDPNDNADTHHPTMEIDRR